MTTFLIIITIVELCFIGYQFKKLQECKKELSYWRQADRMKDELKESSEKPQQ